MHSLKFETRLKSADKKKIEAQLDDAGYGECRVDLEFQELKVPDLYKSEQDLIASVVAQAGDYRLDVIIDDVVVDL